MSLLANVVEVKVDAVPELVPLTFH